MKDLRNALSRLHTRHRLRTHRTLNSPQGVEITVGGRRRINFSSNDYLGLANHPQVRHALIQGARRWGAGSGSAHLICGHSAAHQALAEELADWLGRERVLLFSTGYMANLAAISTLMGRHDLVLADRLNHASLLDAGLLARSRCRRFRHADAAEAAARLAQSTAPDTMVTTDGVFSMDGDIAPLAALAQACGEHRAWLLVDDAHGIGVLGPGGRGCVAQAGLTQHDVPVLVGTLSKAFGTAGAFVAGSAVLIDYLTNHARPYIFTTAPPPAVAEATRAALRLIHTESWRRERLTALIHRFRSACTAADVPLLPTGTAIQPIVIGTDASAVKMAEQLDRQGFLVPAIRPPTVAEGAARLRITLCAEHQDSHIDALVDALAAARRSVACGRCGIV